MKKRVIELVSETVKKYSSHEKPNFDEICSTLGLNVKVKDLPIGTDGLQKDKIIIINSQVQYEERKRFTQFHELTHYLIENDADLYSELLEFTHNQENGCKEQLETLSNIGAAEFLMPRMEFTKLSQEKGFNVELILHAADHFKTSTIAATIQLAEVAPNECIATVWEYGSLPNNNTRLHDSLLDIENESTNKSKLHVIYSTSSPAASHRWLVKYTTFPNDHLINQAFREGKMLKDECYIHFPRWKEQCTCEALPYKNRVYALFHLTAPPSPRQMKLL